jgi:lipopolysaccharide export LptBFGC system permease protein LptF
MIFCLLGVSLTLLPRQSRANRSWGFMLCLFWLMAYYALLSLGKALGENNLLHPLLALWLPNLVVGGIALHFFRKALHETPLALPGIMEQILSRATQWINRRRDKQKSVTP